MKWTRAAPLVLLSALATLAACQTTPTPSAGIRAVAQAPFCAVAEPILYSSRDTPETQKQIREHNAIGGALGCPAFALAGGGR